MKTALFAIIFILLSSKPSFAQVPYAHLKSADGNAQAEISLEGRVTLTVDDSLCQTFGFNSQTINIDVSAIDLSDLKSSVSFVTVNAQDVRCVLDQSNSGCGHRGGRLHVGDTALKSTWNNRVFYSDVTLHTGPRDDDPNSDASSFVGAYCRNGGEGYPGYGS